MSVYMQVRREIRLKQPQLLIDESKPVLRYEHGRDVQASYLQSPPLRSYIRAYRVFDLDAAPRLRASLLGATTEPLSYGGTEGRYRFIAVEFVPAVMHGLVREPAGAFTNCMVDSGAFYDTQALDLVIEQLSEASTSETRCAVLDRFFESRLSGADVAVDPGVSDVIGHIDANRGPISMGLLAQNIGVSERALGFIYHMPSAATINIITACGFSDQAHLTHEVRHFTLATPGKLRRDNAVGPGPLRDFFPHPF